MLWINSSLTPVAQDERLMAETLRFCEEQQDSWWGSSNLWVMSVLMRQNVICESADGVGSCEKAEQEKERLSMNKTFGLNFCSDHYSWLGKVTLAGLRFHYWCSDCWLIPRFLCFCFTLCFVSVSWYICCLSESVVTFTKVKRWTGAKSSQEIRAIIQAENRHFNALTFLAKRRDPQTSEGNSIKPQTKCHVIA